MEMVKEKSLLVFISVILLNIIAPSDSKREYCPDANSLHFGKCGYDGYECVSDGACIKRSLYCNGNRDCSDGSDESYCSYRIPCAQISVRTYRFQRCGSSSGNKCYPSAWRCDRIRDCYYGEDEADCVTYAAHTPVSQSAIASRDSVAWFNRSTVPDSPTRKWGPLVHKTAVALFLSDPSFVSNDSSTRREISYELSIQLLSKLHQKKLQDVPSSELASFVNAFLVTCIDPRDFHGLNLVAELRSRVEKEKNYTMPYVLLALCNAGDTITDSDVENLKDAFWNPKREIWTDVQAIALMALSCAKNQTGSFVDDAMISEFALELKQHQYRNGTVENLQNTLLVMQALYASEPDEDPDNFDEKKALSYIQENKKPDGSFGNLLLTYYALPVLNCKSLVNISSSHCKSVKKDEDTAVFDLMNHSGPKIRVRYSIWLGMKRDIERTLSIRVPANVSFYRVMEIAAEIDNKYKFEYITKNRKPYITSISVTIDDSETEQYWFPYMVKDGKPSLLEQSPADIIPKNDDHIVMWYRKGNWVE